MLLYQGKKDYYYVIKELPDLQLLNILGVRKGIKIHIETKQPLGGPVVIKVGNRNIAIAKTIAKQMHIEELMLEEVVA